MAHQGHPRQKPLQLVKRNETSSHQRDCGEPSIRQEFDDWHLAFFFDARPAAQTALDFLGFFHFPTLPPQANLRLELRESSGQSPSKQPRKCPTKTTRSITKSCIMPLNHKQKAKRLVVKLPSASKCIARMQAICQGRVAEQHDADCQRHSAMLCCVHCSLQLEHVMPVKARRASYALSSAWRPSSSPRIAWRIVK